MLEGTSAQVPPEGGRKHPEQKLISINTRNILFICGGAFEGIEKLVKRRVGQKAMGFGAEVKGMSEYKMFDLLTQLEPKDLLEFGLIPELIGRLPVAAPLDELGEDALMSILQEPKNALIKQYKRLFDMEDVELEIEEEAMREVVKIAQARKTGARALRSVMENLMLDPMFEIPSKKDVKKVTITKDVVTGDAEPVIEYKKTGKQAS